ncbi:MAG: glycosyltransferase [Bacteroidetes bacterium]|nr:glycosyltransferase [Bacteroidota bacterium]
MYIFLYIVLLLLFGYGILIDYYRRSWNDIPQYDPGSPSKEFKTKVTVIIPARNEENNIGRCLESILKQSYPLSLIEIIVVDDHSTDGTKARVNSFNHRCIRLIDLKAYLNNENINSYKKKAIEIAIKESFGELIITTDADCVVPVDWIKSMAILFDEKQAAFIAAPVKINDGHSLLSIFQSLDFITMQGITGASVYKKIYPMCNGANLAYSKAAFKDVNGFEGIDEIASGDDMLLMQKISKKFPDHVFFLKKTGAIVNTDPSLDWKSFLHQRIRWSSKADKYNNQNIFLTLLFVYVLNLCLFSFLIAAFWNIYWLKVFVILVIVKTFVEFSFVKTVADFFGQKRLMLYFFFLQPLHILYIIVAGTLGKFGSYEWKNRKVK